MKFIKNITKSTIIRGTFLLTAAGIISRIIGFFYRITLTRTIGAEGMGLFQMIIPLAGIIFAICSSGIQTAISKYTASEKNRHDTKWLKAGLIISMPVSIALSAFLYIFSKQISLKIYINHEYSNILKVLCFVFPFSSLHNCICGYYLGHKKAGIPAFSQLLEQISRVITVLLYIYICNNLGIKVTVICAIIGNLAGEAASSLFCLLSLFITTFKNKEKNTSTKSSGIENVKEILKYSIPLTLSRLLIHIFQCAEAILVPLQLTLSGYTSNQSLSIYGTLSGMALPMILFPCAVTNALSVMLLPSISENSGKAEKIPIINKTIDKCMFCCLSMGIICLLLFIIYGAPMASIIFNEPQAGKYVSILAWLCPFLYLTTSLSSILNGLGKTSVTCFQNILSVMIRLFFLIAFVPKYGITAYMTGILISQLYLCSSHFIYLLKLLHFKCNVVRWLIIPTFNSLLSCSFSLILIAVLNNIIKMRTELTLLLSGSVLAILLFIVIYFIEINWCIKN